MIPIAAEGLATGRRKSSSALHPRWIETLIPLGVGLVCFTITELMHRLLAPDIGRQKERWLAEAVSAIVVSFLVAKLVAVLHRQNQVLLARVQVISEINHHVRNALMVISASADLSQNQKCNRVILESVQRIDWALREILPRKQPLEEAERTRLMLSQPGPLRVAQENDEFDGNLRIGETK
jgi:signal transduction histidine kinase